MSERSQINRRAVLQMTCLVATLIILLAAMLSQIAFLALITAMSIVAGTIGTGRIWKGRRLAPISDYVERLRDLCRRGLIELYATIQRATTRRPAIVYNVHSRGGSQEIGSQQAQEPQAMSSGVVSEEPAQIQVESDEEEEGETRVSRLSHVERRRQEFRRLERALLTRLKAGRKKLKGKVKKGRKREEEE